MTVEVFVDGACRNNGIPGATLQAACAVVIYEKRKEIARFVRPLGQRSNNQAEYEALIMALLMCRMSDLVDPIIYSDSAVVVNQVTGKWRCTHPSLIPLFYAVESLSTDYSFHLSHVPRKFVRVADKLCNKCLDDLASSEIMNQ